MSRRKRKHGMSWAAKHCILRVMRKHLKPGKPAGQAFAIGYAKCRKRYPSIPKKIPRRKK